MSKIKVIHSALDMGHYGVTIYKCGECNSTLDNDLIEKCPKCGTVFTEKEYKTDYYSFGGSDY